MSPFPDRPQVHPPTCADTHLRTVNTSSWNSLHYSGEPASKRKYPSLNAPSKWSRSCSGKRSVSVSVPVAHTL